MLIHITHEKPNSIGVDDVRDQLVGDVQIRPYNGKYKIYIMPDAEKMTVQAQNAILKTIEEPPEYAVIILLTDNEQGFLDTIRSRCVLIQLKPVPDEQALKEQTREELIDKVTEGIRQTAASETKFSHMLTPEEEHIMPEVIREYLI